jgi:signal transduction histidine kinase
MSSDLERRGGLRFSLQLAAWHTLFFLLVAVGTYAIAYTLIDAALEEDWEFSRARVRRDPGGEGMRVTVEEEYGTAAVSPEARRTIRDQFQDTFFVIAAPLLLIALAGGVAVTFLATAPLRRVAATVDRIVRTGEIGARVPGHRGRGDLAELVALINRLLESNERLLRGVRETLDDVAHDLRTPLTRLRGSAERALTGPDDPAAAREALADCLEESERITALVDALMEVAEAEAGAAPLDREPVAMRPLLAEAVSVFGPAAEEKSIRLVLEEGDEATVQGDRNRLERVFANLLDNAIKYSEEGAAVTVRLAREGGEAVVTVEDTGRGIADDALPRIWDRLYRADPSRSRRGLGLGLSLVRAIVEAHGGSVAAASRTGRGSTFTVRLPL